MTNRKTYIDKLTAQLKHWDDELEKLESKINKTHMDLKDEYYQKLHELKNKREEAQLKYEEIRATGEEAWGELKDGFDQSWNTLNESIKNAFVKIK